MGGEAGKIAVHCQAEIALETGAWERARWDLQAPLCKMEKEAIFCRVGKATEDSSGVPCDLLSSELIPTIWRREKKIAIKFTVIFIAASTLLCLPSQLQVSLTISCMLSFHCTWVATQVQTHNLFAARNHRLRALSPIATDLLDSRFHGSVNYVDF